MRVAFAAILLLAVASIATAQQVDVPIIDLPYNAAHGLRAPSMQQSLGITSSFYETAHTSLQDLFGDRKFLGRTTVVFFDLVTMFGVPAPGSDVWLHEEWHRAVLGARGIDSRNDVYDFKSGGDAVYVSHVCDEDLVRLKREHPAEQVRLQEAGIEGELALVLRLEQERFFHDSRAWHVPLYWIVKLGSLGYVYSGDDPSSDADTDESNADDGADVMKRDFTGHDFIGWMYDLSRPNEPYEARGIHPSGVGIDRYRKTTDLTPDERAFLRRQGRLQALNLLDSNLVGIDDFHANVGGRRVAFNVTASHVLTSFGYAIDANVFLRSGTDKLFVALHRYTNHERSFPGAEVQLLDRALTIAGRELRVSPRVIVWMQPKNQRFRDDEAKPGGLVALRAGLPIETRYGAFVELEGKTAGWVQGVESLEKNVAFRVGVTYAF